MEHQAPEIHRSSLDHVCLQVKQLNLGALAGSGATGAGAILGVLQQALQPPSLETVASSIETLAALGALTVDEHLTPLGQHLASLPVGNVRIGKLLLYGVMFSCLRPMVCMAALVGEQSPFMSPSDKREEARAAKQKFAKGKSDHLTLLSVFEAWLVEKQRGSRASRAFCDENFLKESTLLLALGTTGQYLKALKEIGFVGRSCGNNLDSIDPTLNENKVSSSPSSSPLPQLSPSSLSSPPSSSSSSSSGQCACARCRALCGPVAKHYSGSILF
jgi:HrpA-like RNA helicase